MYAFASDTQDCVWRRGAANELVKGDLNHQKWGDNVSVIAEATMRAFDWRDLQLRSYTVFEAALREGAMDKFKELDTRNRYVCNCRRYVVKGGIYLRGWDSEIAS